MSVSMVINGSLTRECERCALARPWARTARYNSVCWGGAAYWAGYGKAASPLELGGDADCCCCLCSTSTLAVEPGAPVHAAGVESTMAYTQREGSATEASFTALPHSVLTRTDRAGPLWQRSPSAMRARLRERRLAAPLAPSNTMTGLSFSQRFHLPSVVLPPPPRLSCVTRLKKQSL